MYLSFKPGKGTGRTEILNDEQKVLLENGANLLNSSLGQHLQGLQVKGKATVPRKPVSLHCLLGEFLDTRFPVTA